jgi:hypothetical protein
VRFDSLSGGAQREAVFEVALPGRVKSPAGFTFTLQNGAIRDRAGNVAPASTLGAPGTEFADRAGMDPAQARDLGDLTGGAKLHLLDQTPGGLRGEAKFYRIEVRRHAALNIALTGIPGRRALQLEQVREDFGYWPLSRSKANGPNSQTLTYVLTPGVWYLTVGARVPFQYALTISTAPARPATAVARSVTPFPPGITAAPALNFRPFDGRIPPFSQKNIAKAADENQDVLTSVWL